MRNELYEKLSRLMWLTRRHRMDGRAPIADTSHGQGRLLAFLRIKDGVSTKDLAYLLGLQVSSLNELLAKLERAGYVERRPSEQDRRVALIFLTQAGRELALEPERERGDIFACLSEQEQQTLGEYLDRVSAAIEAESGARGGQAEHLGGWMRAAREHMSPEQFEQILAQRHGKGCAGRHWHEFHVHGGKSDGGHEHPRVYRREHEEE